LNHNPKLLLGGFATDDVTRERLKPRIIFAQKQC